MTELLLKSSLKSQSVLPYVSFDNIATLLCNFMFASTWRFKFFTFVVKLNFLFIYLLMLCAMFSLPASSLHSLIFENNKMWFYLYNSSLISKLVNEKYI